MPAQSLMRLILDAPAALAVGSLDCALAASLTAVPKRLQTIALAWRKPGLVFNTKGVVELSPGLPKRAKASLGYPGMPSSGKMREARTMPAPVATRCALPQHRWPLAVLGRGASGEPDAQRCHGFARSRGARKPRVGLVSLGQPWAQCRNTFGVKNQLPPTPASQSSVVLSEALACSSSFSSTPLPGPSGLSLTGKKILNRCPGL